MPLRKGRGTKRKSGRRKTAYKKRYPITLTPTLKYKDISTVSTGINNVALITDCTAGLTQGDGESQIDGNQLLLKSIYIRCGMTSNALVASDDVRFILVRDRMPAGAVPTSADILGAGATINSGLNLTSTRTRFKVLWDHVYHLDFYGPRSREIRKYFKVNTKCTYNSSVQPVANCYFLLQLGTQTNATQQNLDIRTRFTD